MLSDPDNEKSRDLTVPSTQTVPCLTGRNYNHINVSYASMEEKRKIYPYTSFNRKSNQPLLDYLHNMQVSKKLSGGAKQCFMK